MQHQRHVAHVDVGGLVPRAQAVELLPEGPVRRPRRFLPPSGGGGCHVLSGGRAKGPPLDGLLQVLFEALQGVGQESVGVVAEEDLVFLFRVVAGQRQPLQHACTGCSRMYRVFHPAARVISDGVQFVGDAVHECGHAEVLLRDDLLLHLLDGRQLVQTLRRILDRHRTVRGPRLAALRAPSVDDFQQHCRHPIADAHRGHLLSVSGLCEVRLALAQTQLEHEGRIRARHSARAAQRLQKDDEVLLLLSLLVRLP
mmetsp:Transcript_40559/g.67956  ORF Transcript_40559/g.67956 Transcript_40559/m.67956 type:complete len:255 (-) Transcript_40559:1469-2233(-)